MVMPAMSQSSPRRTAFSPPTRSETDSATGHTTGCLSWSAALSPDVIAVMEPLAMTEPGRGARASAHGMPIEFRIASALILLPVEI